MPRRPRIAVPDIPMHIIQRGNNRSACFHANDDYRFYLRNLGELLTRFECSLHAFVLMTNHVHLLLTPHATDAASMLMKHLGQRHAQYMNRTYGRSGTLWEGRYRSCLVEEDAYLLCCYRYVEMNPVRAGIVAHPNGYVWSSHASNVGRVVAPMLSPHPCYLQLGHSTEAREAAYRAMFGDELDPSSVREIRRATNGNLALGTDRFRQKIESALGRRASVGEPGRPPRRGQTTLSHASEQQVPPTLNETVV